MLLDYKTCEYLPSAQDLPDSDDTPVDNELQHLIPGLLEAILALIWSERLDWFFGVDMGIYYHPDEPAIVPDGFLSVGVPRILDENLRLSYVLWEETKVPILVLEVVSQKRRQEYTQKKQDYAQMGVLYYVIYNPLRKRKQSLEVYQLEGGEYHLLEGEPIWLSELGLGIGKERGTYQGVNREWLYWYDQQGNRYLTPEESIEQRWLEGQQKGRQDLIFKLLSQKFGQLPLRVEQKIRGLTPEKLDNLALAFLDFSQLEDLRQWLNAHG